MDPRLFGLVVFDRGHPALLRELRRLEQTFDPDRVWASKDGRPYRLSDRVWDAGQEARRNIDRLLKEAMATGEDSLVTATKLETYLDPRLQPIRDASGRLVRDTAANRRRFPELAEKQRRSVLTFAPGRGGRGSYAARRLARTEIARAHAEATQRAAELNPWVEGLRYRLSGNHPKPDECDRRANRDDGRGRGVYPIRGCPLPPAHPHCRCFVVTVQAENADAVVDALRVRYGLGDPTVAVAAAGVPIGDSSFLAAIGLVERAIALANRLIAERIAA